MDSEKVILGGPNPSHSHYQTATTQQAVTEVTLTVRSEDYGGWGSIEKESHAEKILESMQKEDLEGFQESMAKEYALSGITLHRRWLIGVRMFRFPWYGTKDLLAKDVRDVVPQALQRLELLLLKPA